MNVPKIYWGHAVLTASYHINYRPACALGKKSLLEVLSKSLFFLFILKSLDVPVLFETIIQSMESWTYVLLNVYL